MANDTLSERNGASAPKRLAVIDIGSNSIRLVVVEVCPGADFRILDDERESTRLASSLSTTGKLSAKSIDATLEALRQFQRIAEGFQVHRLKAIATCAVREANNGEHFCRRALQEIGLKIDVIDAVEEAQYAFLSVKKSFDISDNNIAIADIGGASTEIVLASAGHVEEIYGTALGAVRLTESYCSKPRLLDDGYKPLIKAIDRELKRCIGKLPFHPQVLYGSGGTLTNLASMLRAARGDESQPDWGYRIARADVRHQLDLLQKMSLKQRRGVDGLNSDRADIIVAGLAIVDRLMRYLKVNILQVHNRGVRDGVIWKIIEHLQPQPSSAEDQELAIERFIVSCGADLAHARQVASIASMIFEQLYRKFDLRQRDGFLLQLAAMLQDVGYLINYDRHHKHSYQLIINSQLPGIPRHELELVANVARYHRGAKPKRKHSTFAKLDRDDQRRVRQLAGILRIAGGLDRSHTQQVESVKLELVNGKAIFTVRSSGDAEVDIWAAQRRTVLFERAFGMKVNIHYENETTDVRRVVPARSHVSISRN